MNQFMVAFYKNDVLTIQRSEYIESGWRVECRADGKFHLFEIPEHGGEPHVMGVFDSFSEAEAVFSTWT